MASTTGLRAILTLTPVRPRADEDGIPHRQLHFTSPYDTIDVGRSSKSEGKNLMPDVENAWFTSRVISRNHAKIFVKPDQKEIFIKDIGSMHGTYIGKVRLPPAIPHLIHDNDILQFGSEVSRATEVFPPLEMRATCKWEDINDYSSDYNSAASSERGFSGEQEFRSASQYRSSSITSAQVTHSSSTGNWGSSVERDVPVASNIPARFDGPDPSSEPLEPGVKPGKDYGHLDSDDSDDDYYPEATERAHERIINQSRTYTVPSDQSDAGSYDDEDDVVEIEKPPTTIPVSKLMQSTVDLIYKPANETTLEKDPFTPAISKTTIIYSKGPSGLTEKEKADDDLVFSKVHQVIDLPDDSNNCNGSQGNPIEIDEPDCRPIDGHETDSDQESNSTDSMGSLDDIDLYADSILEADELSDMSEDSEQDLQDSSDEEDYHIDEAIQTDDGVSEDLGEREPTASADTTNAVNEPLCREHLDQSTWEAPPNWTDPQEDNHSEFDGFGGGENEIKQTPSQGTLKNESKGDSGFSRYNNQYVSPFTNFNEEGTMLREAYEMLLPRPTAKATPGPENPSTINTNSTFLPSMPVPQSWIRSPSPSDAAMAKPSTVQLSSPDGPLTCSTGIVWNSGTAHPAATDYNPFASASFYPPFPTASPLYYNDGPFSIPSSRRTFVPSAEKRRTRPSSFEHPKPSRETVCEAETNLEPARPTIVVSTNDLITNKISSKAFSLEEPRSASYSSTKLSIPDIVNAETVVDKAEKSLKRKASAISDTPQQQEEVTQTVPSWQQETSKSASAIEKAIKQAIEDNAAIEKAIKEAIENRRAPVPNEVLTQEQAAVISVHQDSTEPPKKRAKTAATFAKYAATAVGGMVAGGVGVVTLLANLPPNFFS